MKEVLVQYIKTGKVVSMKQHFADILVKVKHVKLYKEEAETLQKPEAVAPAAHKNPTGAQKNKPGRKPGKGKQTYITRDLTAQDI